MNILKSEWIANHGPDISHNEHWMDYSAAQLGSWAQLKEALEKTAGRYNILETAGQLVKLSRVRYVVINAGGKEYLNLRENGTLETEYDEIWIVVQ